MDGNAVLGPIDPQIGEYPAASLLKLVKTKPIDKIDDDTFIKADAAAKAMEQVTELAYRLLSKHLDPEAARQVAERLSQGTWTHDYPITAEEAQSLGLKVSTQFPSELHEIMSLYPQAQMRRPSVQYIPLPYRKGGGE